MRSQRSRRVIVKSAGPNGFTHRLPLVVHEALGEHALAGRLFERVDRGRRMARLAHTPARAWEGQSLGVPVRDARNEAILVGLVEHGTRLEAFGNELRAGRVEIGG